MAINKISGNILQDNLQRGTNLSVQGNLIYFDVNTNRVGIRTSSPGSDLEVVGVLEVGAVTIDSAGNIDAGGVNINDLAEPVANADAATKFYVDSQTGNVSASLGNFVFANTTVTTNLAQGNITLAPTGNSTVIIDTVSGLVLPVGTTAERPSPAAQGTVRFNSDSDRVEVYDGTGWDDVVANVTNQTLNGDGSTAVFTLDRDTTAAAALVMLNGVVQLPAVAYTVAGNQLTFAQAPVISDVIDVRFL
jgi:hypothetical protein